jgi:hypothetical protein
LFESVRGDLGILWQMQYCTLGTITVLSVNTVMPHERKFMVLKLNLGVDRPWILRKKRKGGEVRGYEPSRTTSIREQEVLKSSRYGIFITVRAFVGMRWSYCITKKVEHARALSTKRSNLVKQYRMTSQKVFVREVNIE